MAGFELELKLKNIEKVYQLPKVLDNVVSKWEKVSKIQKNIEEDSNALVNALRKQGASAERIWFIQRKANWQKFFVAARNPLSLISKGLLSVGSLIGTATIAFFKWLAPIIFVAGAIGGLVAIFKRLFAFNIGGIATQFYRIGGAIKLAWYKALNDIVKLFKELDPIIRPIITFIGDKLVGIIKGFSAWVTALTKNENVIKGLKTYYSGIVELFKVWWSVVQQFFRGFSQGFKGIFGDTQKGTSGFMDFMNVLIKISSIMYKIIEYTHLFQILGATLGIAFGTVATILKIIAALIEGIADSFKPVMEGIKGFQEGGLTGAIKGYTQSALEVGAKYTNKTMNNNITVNSSGPITPESAPRIGNVLSSQIFDASWRG